MRRSCRIALLAAALAAGIGAGPADADEWLAGDLHVHTTYSHDSWSGPGDDNTDADQFYTLGHSVASQFAIAASRGLRFLAITDHDDIRSQRDPGFGSAGVLPLPGYEISLRGHGQMLGARRIYSRSDQSVAGVRRLADELRADGGVFQANHPSDPVWAYAYDVPVETVEGWNIPWPYQPPFPAAADNDRATRYWHGWLDRGERVGLTGGSDNHWVSTTAAQGVGQPTAWVYVRERSVRGILEGLRTGRTFVSHQPPAYAGTQVLLSADANANGKFESIVGDTVPPGTLMRVQVVNGAGGFLNVFTDKGARTIGPMPITSDRFEHRFRLPGSATWTHAQVYGEDTPEGRTAGCNLVAGADLAKRTTYCTNRVAMLAMTSAMFFRSAGSRPVGGAPGTVVIGPSGSRPGSRPSPACPDRLQPYSYINRYSLRLRRELVMMTGRAWDRPCRPPNRRALTVDPRVGRVEVAIARLDGARCRFLRSNGRLGARRSCGRALFLRAAARTGSRESSWSLRRPASLPPGTYRITSRAVDRSGNAERYFHRGRFVTRRLR